MPSRTLVLATRNQGKIREFEGLLAGFEVAVKGLDSFGPIPAAVEDGKTFEENAFKKALHTARVLGLPALADDSGLVVETLGGDPGVRSARYSGENATDLENNRKLLQAMDGKANRKAAFQCVIAVAVPSFFAGVGGMSEFTMMTGRGNWPWAYPFFFLVMAGVGLSTFFLVRYLEKYWR